MPEDPIAPLIVANPAEVQKSWEDLESPTKFAQWIKTVFGVDLASLAEVQNVVVGPGDPSGSDRGKVHAKTSEPYAIGIPVAGRYQYIYEYPPNTPIQYITDGDESSIPSYLRQLTDAELTKYDLTDGDNYQWVILDV